MSIPLISNASFTEINQSVVDSNSGILNDIAGTIKSKLPIQIFRLTEAISGNLQMNSDSAHKKIILDTNGFNLINDTGSPITNNSSAALDLRGGGNVQSSVKQFTVTGSGEGTTTIDNTNSSTITRASDPDYPSTAVSGGYQPSFGTGAPNSSSIFVIADGQTQGPNGYGSAWRLRVPSGQTWKVGSDILSAGTTLNASQNNTAIGASSFNKITSFGVIVNDTPNPGDNLTSFPAGGWTSGFNSDSNKYEIRRAFLGDELGSNVLVYNVTLGRWEARLGSGQLTYNDNGRRGNTPPPQTITLSIDLERERQTFTFTNNLSIPCVLSGNDPYDNVTVNSSDTAAETLVGADDSFDITGTISGENESNQPYSLLSVNDGTGGVTITNYTGILSARAF